MPILSTTEREWDRHFDVNAKGQFICSKAVADRMIEDGVAGSIVNVASVALFRPGTEQGAYSASKGAVASFTRALAMELAEHGINANYVNPGGVRTPMFEQWLVDIAEMGGSSKETILDEVDGESSIQRLGTPEYIGNLVTFLLSDEAEWITGEGYTIRGAQAL